MTTPLTSTFLGFNLEHRLLTFFSAQLRMKQKPPEVFKINLDESFEHLPRAPIVEAVIDIRCRPSEPLEEATLQALLTERIPEYHFLDSQREFEGEMTFAPRQPVSQTVRDRGWKGLRFKSADGKHIAQFNRDGFIFSRLDPYQNWAQMTEEALRIWEFYRESAQPTEVQRIGLRFINRIRIPAWNHHISDFIHAAPTPPHGLPFPFLGFIHRDTLAVPGYTYLINFARTIQPATEQSSGAAIILDIDVFTNQPFPLDPARLLRHLEEMRWLKNKVFFGSVKEETLKLCRS